VARGGYYIGIKDLDEFVAALEQTADGMDDLGAVFERIGKTAERWVKRNVPRGTASPKDSKTHKPPGYLQSIVLGGHGKWGSWVQMADESGVLTLQEWGGKSVWRRGGAQWSPTKKRGRSTGAFTVSHKKATPSHVVYEKPRRKNGYFIWNAGYQLRDEIGELLADGLAMVAAKHGIAIDIATGALDIRADGRPAT
jgi:hypothetical protein